MAAVDLERILAQKPAVELLVDLLPLLLVWRVVVVVAPVRLYSLAKGELVRHYTRKSKASERARTAMRRHAGQVDELLHHLELGHLAPQFLGLLATAALVFVAVRVVI